MENKLVKQTSGLIKSPILEAITTTKIKDESLSNIAAHIKRVFILLGISGKNVPNELEFDFMVNTYKQAFLNYTVKEMDLAFNLALQGAILYELNLYDKSFSVAFVSELMKKYSEWKISNTDYKKNKLTVTVEKSPEQIYAEMKQACINAFTEYKSGNDYFVKFHIYDWMDKNEFINTTKERKNNFFAEAKSELYFEMESEKQLSVTPSDVQKVIDKYSGTTKQKNRAKELNLKDFFDGLIEMDTELEDLLILK